MAIHGVDPKCYILALFVRDDKQRFLLGDDPFEFKDKQLHFQPNVIANDVVEVQGNDGVLLAGQVRRAGTQEFDGYVGNGTTSKAEVEVRRREFLQFFRKNHFYKVIYVFPDGSAIQRKQGFLVDDPTVEELYQQYPAYHVALNFQDVNYYTYSEDDEGEEIYSEEAIIKLVGGGATGGLIWDSYGVVWEEPWSDEAEAEGTEIQVNNNNPAKARIDLENVCGDTFQQTYSGAQLLKKDGMATPSTDTTYWASFATNLTQTPKNNGWSNMTRTVTSGFSNFQTSTSSVDIVAGSTYTAIVEIENCTITSGAMIFTQTNATQDPVESYTIVAGCNSEYEASIGVYLTGSTTPKYNVYVFNTKSGFTRGLRYFIGQYSGSGSFDVRATVLAGDHSSDWQNYCGDNWQPYVGSTTTQIVPSPNPDYPQDVQVVTGEQTVDVYDKNLYLPIPGAHPDHGIGATYDSATGEITLIGTGNDTWSNTFQWSAITLSPGKYTVSLTDTIPLNARIRFVYNDSTYVDGPISSGGKVVTVTAANEVKGIRLWFSGTNGVDVNGVKFRIQVEEGENATDFQLHGRYPINLGKNLLNISDFAMGGMSSGQPSASTYRINNALNPIKVLPSTTYTLSVQLGSTVKGYRVGVHECGEDGTFIRDLGWKQLVPGSYSFTTDSDTYIIKLVGSLSTTSDNVTTGGTENTTSCSTVEEFMRGCKLQFEFGSISTSMSDYFTPIELCKIGDYQDYIYKSGDDWYLHKEIGKDTLDGTEIFQKSGANENVSFYWARNYSGQVPRFANIRESLITQTGAGIDYVFPFFANRFTRMSTNQVIYSSSIGAGFNRLSSSNLNFRMGMGLDTTINDVTKFTNFVSSNPITVYYPLETFTNTKITNQDLISQLDALDSSWLFIGQNNILVSASSPNLPAPIKFSYMTKYTPLGAEWEEGGTKGPTIVDVNAIDNTYPVWELTGPSVNPTISVITTNTTLTYVGTITASQKLEIDMLNKTATLNGTSVIGNVSGDWVYMAPGTNRISYTAGNTDAPDSTLYWQEVVG